MNKTQRPDPAQIARLIEDDELIRYAVEELGGQITAIRGLRNSIVRPDQFEIGELAIRKYVREVVG
ncbi:MAG: hypothetical protein JXB07_09850 [Anaerolineae bacterium]|nr:hypothetical protein [Anaerolineae bacterium]